MIKEPFTAKAWCSKVLPKIKKEKKNVWHEWAGVKQLTMDWALGHEGLGCASQHGCFMFRLTDHEENS